jgi:hypothetical protein
MHCSVLLSFITQSKLTAKQCFSFTVTFYSGSYAVVLNGYESITRALLGKAAQFAERVATLAGSVLNEDLKGLSLTAWLIASLFHSWKFFATLTLK